MNKKPTIFEPYPFTVGERILRRRKGKLEDWDVIEINDNEIKVKCPFHGTELTWKRNHFWFGGDNG
jgi:hypothetical protein